MMTKTIYNISIADFDRQYKKEYSFLYDNADAYIAGFDEAVTAFDEFIKVHSDFVREYAAYRGDFIMSDREAAAFMFALDALAN